MNKKNAVLSQPVNDRIRNRYMLQILCAKKKTQNCSLSRREESYKLKLFACLYVRRVKGTSCFP
jgi:hypothetical protein